MIHSIHTYEEIRLGNRFSLDSSVQLSATIFLLNLYMLHSKSGKYQYSWSAASPEEILDFLEKC